MSVQEYDTAIPDAFDALEAVRRLSGAGPDSTIETVAELLAGTDLRDGEVLCTMTSHKKPPPINHKAIERFENEGGTTNAGELSRK
jgi:hypothetical protein